MADLALAEAALKALADAVKTQLADVRERMQKEMETSGASRVDAMLPDGTKVATVSLSQPKPTARVTDEDTLRAWVREHAPGELHSRVVTEIRPAYLTSLLAQLTAAGAPDLADAATGEIAEVPGVEVAAGRASTHSVRLAEGGAEAIVEAWRTGALAHLDLPQLGPGGAS
jgi:hypothetical protein